MRTRIGALLLAAVGGLLLVGLAQAHAGYKRSEPGDGAVVSAPPGRVDIWFAQELFRRQGENWIHVIGPDGQAADEGDPQIDDNDRTHMWVGLKPGLVAGTYVVEWRTLSADDGDAEEGRFTFTFDPQAAVTSTPPAVDTAPASSPPQTPTVGVTAAPAASNPSGGLCGLGLLPVAGFISLALRRRSRGTPCP